MDLRNSAIIIEFKLSFVDETLLISLLQLEVITRRYVVMLVCVDALEHVIFLEAELDQFIQDDSVDGDLGETDKDPSCDSRQDNCSVPSMLPNVSNSMSLLWVSVQNTAHHVSGVLRDELRDLEVATQDLLIQVARVRVFKWQVAADEGEKDDTNGPYVNMRSMVALACDHFRCGVAR